MVNIFLVSCFNFPLIHKELRVMPTQTIQFTSPLAMLSLWAVRSVHKGIPSLMHHSIRVFHTMVVKCYSSSLIPSCFRFRELVLHLLFRAQLVAMPNSGHAPKSRFHNNVPPRSEEWFEKNHKMLNWTM